MKPEDSIILNEFSKRVNEAIASNQSPDFSAIELDMLRDPDLLPIKFRKELNTSLHEHIKDRSQVIKDSRNRVAKEWGNLLDSLQRCIALGELIHKRAEDMFHTGFDELKMKTPRPDPEAVTGAMLKCLLLLGIHARSCIIASETLLLLRSGFPDGAYSRLRTLHEHAVVMTLIGNDHTYEVAERYQDRACFEYLNLLRGTKRCFTDAQWRDTESVQQRIDQEISETEADVRKARARWGRDIAEQYGWARPALPSSMRANQRITFADLESAADMDFYRINYLEGNYNVHAGAHSVIQDAEFDEHIYAIRPSAVNVRIQRASERLVLIFGFMSQMLAQVVAKETEEWDGYLFAAAMTRIADQLYETISNRPTDDQEVRTDSPPAA